METHRVVEQGSNPGPVGYVVETTMEDGKLRYSRRFPTRAEAEAEAARLSEQQTPL
jgi:hypothetical protein